MSEYRRKSLKELESLRNTFPKDSPEHKQAKAEIRRRMIIFAIGIFFLSAFVEVAIRYISGMAK